LEVRAIGLNRAESMFYRGQYIYQPKFPAGLGYEAAGIVDTVGPDVEESWIGKQVSTIPAFSLNEYSMLGETAVAPVEALAEYPANLSPAEGAAIWMQ
jgi:NADPH:quinone reductase-like Zn-dependent oxidoreductase